MWKWVRLWAPVNSLFNYNYKTSCTFSVSTTSSSSQRHEIYSQVSHSLCPVSDSLSSLPMSSVLVSSCKPWDRWTWDYFHDILGQRRGCFIWFLMKHVSRYKKRKCVKIDESVKFSADLSLLTWVKYRISQIELKLISLYIIHDVHWHTFTFIHIH